MHEILYKAYKKGTAVKFITRGNHWTSTIVQIEDSTVGKIYGLKKEGERQYFIFSTQILEVIDGNPVCVKIL
jgi:hypothetical protein